MINPETFDKVTSGIQSIVTTVGIVAAGVWALYTFWGQHIVQKANLDVAKTEREIRKIEQDSLEQPVLRTTIAPADFRDDGYPNSITVTFKNDGKLALEFRETVISLMPMANKEASQADKSQPIRVDAKLLGDDGKFSKMPERILRTGQDRNLAFMFPKIETGVYFVELRTTYYGMKILDGDFVKSNDVPVYAIDQAVLRVPGKLDAQKSEPQPPKEQPLQKPSTALTPANPSPASP